jgi:hypothetical protein
LDVPVIEEIGDFVLELPLLHERPIHPLDRFDLDGGAGHQNDAVRLEALVLPAAEGDLMGAILVHEHPAQAVAGRTALAVADFDQAALTGKHLCGLLPAILASIKTVMAWTGAGERTVKAWLADSNAPRAFQLECLIRSSEVVYERLMVRTGRKPVANCEGLEALKGELIGLVEAIENALA